MRRHGWFIIPCFVFLIVGGAVLAIFPKGPLHLWINGWHSVYSDTFFAYYTCLGDGWAVVVLTVILLVVRFRTALIVAASNIVCSLVTQFLKHSVFPDALRPTAFFGGTAQLHLVPGVDVYSYNSFPSGHAAVAFATCLALAMSVESRTVKAILFVIAFTVAFSRVYLSEHFFGDMYAGAPIGLAVTLVIAAVVGRSGGPWLDRSLRNMRGWSGSDKTSGERVSRV